MQDSLLGEELKNILAGIGIVISPSDISRVVRKVAASVAAAAMLTGAVTVQSSGMQEAAETVEQVSDDADAEPDQPPSNEQGGATRTGSTSAAAENMNQPQTGVVAGTGAGGVGAGAGGVGADESQAAVPLSGLAGVAAAEALGALLPQMAQRLAENLATAEPQEQAATAASAADTPPAAMSQLRQAQNAARRGGVPTTPPAGSQADAPDTFEEGGEEDGDEEAEESAPPLGVAPGIQDLLNAPEPSAEQTPEEEAAAAEDTEAAEDAASPEVQLLGGQGMGLPTTPSTAPTGTEAGEGGEEGGEAGEGGEEGAQEEPEAAGPTADERQQQSQLRTDRQQAKEEKAAEEEKEKEGQEEEGEGDAGEAGAVGTEQASELALERALLAVWSIPLPTAVVAWVYIHVHLMGYFGQGFSPIKFSKPKEEQWTELGLILLLDLLVFVVIGFLMAMLGLMGKVFFAGGLFDKVVAVWNFIGDVPIFKIIYGIIKG